MKLQTQWRRVRHWPFRRFWIWLVLRHAVPYSSNILPDIVEWEDGHVRVELRDRRSVRNHLRSVHAVALMNLCELTSGLGVISAIPENIKGIPINFSIQFKKKARGLLTAEAVARPPEIKQRTEYKLTIDVRDEKKDVVCSAEVTWLLQPA